MKMKPLCNALLAGAVSMACTGAAWAADAMKPGTVMDGKPVEDKKMDGKAMQQPRQKMAKEKKEGMQKDMPKPGDMPADKKM